MTHRHEFANQALVHEHAGDDQPHGYYGHDEDKGSPSYGQGTYQYLGTGTGPSAQVEVTRTGARTDRTRYFTLKLLAGESGRTVLVVQNNYTGHAESYALPAGNELVTALSKVASRPDALEALQFVLEQPVGGPSCGCGLKHWDCDEDIPGESAKVYGGYTHDQLSAAFELVKPMHNWKLAIKATVPGSTDVMLLHAAVEFFTGGEAAIVSDPKTGTLHVTAPGYYACIGS